MAGAVVPGTALAVVGAFTPALAGPVMVGGAALAAAAAWPAVRPGPGPGEPAEPGGAGRHVAAALAVLGVVVLSALHFQRSGQWILSDRDPGAVAGAAGGLADTGRLDAPAAPGAFASVPYADAGTAQGWFRDGTRVVPQFMHGMHVVLAAARWVGGDGALLKMNAAIGALGALALFVLAVRWVPPWAAAGAVVTLTALAPQAYVLRGPFSEVPAQALLVGGTALLLAAAEREDRRALVAAGMVLGAVALIRIDAVLAFAGLGPWVAVRAHRARRLGMPGPGLGRWIALGAGLAGAVAVADALGPARPYIDLHASEVGSQLVLVGLVWGVAAAVYAARRHRAGDGGDDVGEVPGWAGPAGTAAAAAVVAVTAALWFLRPVLETAREGAASYNVEVLQRDAGVMVDATRRYFEDSVRWFSWYLGPTGLALAVAGLAGAVRRLVQGAEDDRLFLVTALAAVPTAVFVWRVRTEPDHLWVMRRFTLTTLPLLVVTAWAAAAGLGAAAARRLGRPAARGVAAVAALGVAVPVLAASWPLRDMTLQAGALDAVDAACADAGDDAAILVLGEETAALTLPAALRYACAVPVAGAVRPVAAGELQDLARAWAERGRRLVAVSDTAAALRRVLGDVPTTQLVAANPHQPRPTLLTRPRDLRRLDIPLALARVPLAPPGEDAAGSPRT